MVVATQQHDFGSMGPVRKVGSGRSHGQGYVARFMGRASAVMGVVILGVGLAAQPSVAQTPIPSDANAIVPVHGAPESFADLAESLLPSVVNISTTQRMADRGPQMPQVEPGTPLDEFFRDFFERRRGDGGEGEPRRRGPRATSLGSGFIISDDGLIVTNNHVIEGADEITVILQDDTSLEAELVGRDEKTDIAVLRVESDTPLPAVPLGESSDARVGDWVVAIGNPFGLGGSVTAGIISAKTRDINAGPYDSFIQTDASINRGNSGGPLFNMAGEVIGINTAIYSPTGGSVGIGFAVPTSLAKQVIADLTEFGRTRRGWIGVRIQSVTDDIADSLGLPASTGALVAAVTPGGPAEAAGILAGDVILRFDGKDVPEMRDLPRIVAETTIDKSSEIIVWRGDEEVSLSLSVGELEVAEEQGLLDSPSRVAANDNDPGRSVDSLGVTVAPVSDGLREEYELTDETDGLVVISVDANSDAAEKGLRPGSVIVSVNQQSVASASDLSDVVDSAKDQGRKTVLMLVDTAGTQSWIAVAIG